VWVLLAVVVVVVGFALRINAMLVVTVAGIVAGAIAGMSPIKVLDAFGTGFAGSRSVTVFVLTLPVVGLIERYGLQQQARRLISRLRVLTTGRFLALYLLIRQATAAVGLTSIAGPAQSLRPLVAPMAEGAAERRYGGRVSERVRERIKGFSASADTVGLFFGEDIFVAVGSILLITGFVDTTYDLKLDALDIALWAIPTALVALAVHGSRLLWLDRKLDRMTAEDGGRPVRDEQAGVAR
jgi:uncharacterized membrane protein